MPRTLLARTVIVTLLVAGCAGRAPHLPPVRPARYDEQAAPPPPPPPPPRWAPGPLPPAPERSSTPEESHGSRPEGWQRADQNFAPPAYLREAPAADGPGDAGPPAGLWCSVSTPSAGELRGVRRVSWRLGPHRLESYVSREGGTFVPLVDPGLVGPVAVDVFHRPKADLFGLAVGILFVVPLPFVLHDMRERHLGQAKGTLEGPPFQLVSPKVKVACAAVSRAAVERALAPLLERAQHSIARARPQSVDLLESDLGIRFSPGQEVERQIAAAAGLVGWADPRVTELVSRYEAAMEAYRDITRSKVSAALALAPAAAGLEILSGSATVLGAGVQCDRRQVRLIDPYDTRSRCVLRVQLRNDGHGALSSGAAARGWDALDSAGEGFKLRRWRVVPAGSKRQRFPLAPGSTVELAFVLEPSQGAPEPARPLLVRHPPRGPMAVFEAEEWTALGQQGVLARVGKMRCHKVEAERPQCIVPIEFRPLSEQERPFNAAYMHPEVVSPCDGERRGSLWPPSYSSPPPTSVNFRPTLPIEREQKCEEPRFGVVFPVAPRLELFRVD